MVIVIAILLFGLLIFVHELGHFVTAKLFDIEIHEFSIGMGPAILKKEKGGILYSLRLLPIGGYVKMEGEDGDSEHENAFCKKSPLKRLIVLISGAAMNILMGFIIFLIFCSMQSQVETTVVGKVLPDTPAYNAGIEPGDRIIAVNGNSVHIPGDARFDMHLNGNKTAIIKIDRNGQRMDFNIKPVYSKESQNYIIGYTCKAEQNNLLKTVKYAYYNTFFSARVVYVSLFELIGGKIPITEMSGPVGIVNEVGKVSASAYPVLNILSFMALIAVNLGIMNMLPLPALDGGRAFFALLEMIRKKPINPEKEGMVHFIGFILLMILMVFVTWSDISKLW